MAVSGFDELRASGLKLSGRPGLNHSRRERIL